MNQFHATAICVGAFGPRFRIERALQIVDEREELLDDFGSRRFGEGRPFTARALAVVLELRSLPKQEVFEFVALTFGLAGWLLGVDGIFDWVFDGVLAFVFHG
jgi:hypothetical protein